MTKRSVGKPWLFINSEMLKFATMLAGSKLAKDRRALAKAVFELVCSRFESPKHSVRIIRTYSPEAAHRIWERGGKAGSLKQAIVLKAALLATGEFGDSEVRVMRADPPYYSPASGGYFFIKLRPDKSPVYLDPWAWNWNVPFGGKIVKGKGAPFTVPDVRGEWDRKHQTEHLTMYLLE